MEKEISRSPDLHVKKERQNKPDYFENLLTVKSSDWLDYDFCSFHEALINPQNKNRERAWSKVYEIVQKFVKHQAFRSFWSEDDYRDLSGDVMIKLMESIQTLREPRSIFSFIRRISIFHVIDEFRRIRGIPEILLAAPENEEHDPIQNLPDSTIPSPETVVEFLEGVTIFQKILDDVYGKKSQCKRALELFIEVQIHSRFHYLRDACTHFNFNYSTVNVDLRRCVDLIRNHRFYSSVRTIADRLLGKIRKDDADNQRPACGSMKGE